jgi:hypothetical protein
MNRENPELDALLREYRTAVEVPEATARFMPSLWEKIDSRRVFTLRLKRLTQVFVGSAAVICLIITGLFVTPGSSNGQAHATYVDVLADAHPTENLIAQGITHSDPMEARH